MNEDRMTSFQKIRQYIGREAKERFLKQVKGAPPIPFRFQIKFRDKRLMFPKVTLKSNCTGRKMTYIMKIIFIGLILAVFSAVILLFNFLPDETARRIFNSLQLIAYIWATLGIIIYFCERGNRKKQKHYQAWQVINLAQGKTGSGGRIQALQELNKDGVSLVGINIVEAFLEGIDLQEADLRGVNFRKTDLQGADLSGADLQGADLSGADLQGADLQKVNLQKANLQGVDLREANLQEADLREADLLEGDYLRAYNLRTADLDLAFFNDKKGNYLQGANLQKANLRKTNLQGADLRGVDLREAKYITVGQLSKVKTLYKAKLDPELEEQIRKNYPHLLEEPKALLKTSENVDELFGGLSNKSCCSKPPE